MSLNRFVVENLYKIVLLGASKRAAILKARFLSRSIKLLADPAEPGVTRTHPPRTALGKALVALLGGNQFARQADRTGGGTVQVQCTSTVHVHVEMFKGKKKKKKKKGRAIEVFCFIL